MSMLRPMPIASVAIRWSTHLRLVQRHHVARAAERAEHDGRAAAGGGVPARRARASWAVNATTALRQQARHLGGLDVGQAEKRGRLISSASGTSCRISGRIVSAPRNMVSSRPRAQQPVGEHVAALGVGAQLDLVDREETDLEVLGHGLDRGDEVARRRRP